MNDEAANPFAKGRVTYNILKSQDFRVVYADGVFGGLTPRGLVQMGFFNERAPFPTQVTYAISAEGALGAEDTGMRAQRQGLVRELDVAVTMSVSGARALVEWLEGKIKEHEAITAAKGSPDA